MSINKYFAVAVVTEFPSSKCYDSASSMDICFLKRAMEWATRLEMNSLTRPWLLYRCIVWVYDNHILE